MIKHKKLESQFFYFSQLWQAENVKLPKQKKILQTLNVTYIYFNLTIIYFKKYLFILLKLIKPLHIGCYNQIITENLTEDMKHS